MPERFGSNESTYDALRGQTLGLPVDGGASGADSTYLRLDTTNDPLTGPLDITVSDANALRVIKPASGGVGSFPTTSILDNFNRANEGPPPSASWQNMFDWVEPLIVSGNQAIPQTPVNGGAAIWKTAHGQDLEAYVTLSNAGIGAHPGVNLYFKIQDPATYADLYYVGVFNSGGDISLVLYSLFSGYAGLTNTYPPVVTLPTGPLESGFKVGVRMIGNIIEIYYARSGGPWVLFIGGTDESSTGPACASGYFGIETIDNDGNSTALDDFGGGTISGGTPAETIFNVNSTTDRSTTVDHLVVTVATGTAPVQVTSTTVNPNLNADMLDGSHSSAFAPSALTNAHIFVGNVSNVATDVALSNDATLSNTGALTLKNTGPGVTGPIGDATHVPVVTIDAQGRVTALTSTAISANVTGTGTTNRVAKFTGASTIGDSNLIGAGAGTLTLSAANTHTATFPATGSDTVAMLGTANVFTANNTWDTNTLFVDSANHRVGVGTTSPTALYTSKARAAAVATGTVSNAGAPNYGRVIGVGTLFLTELQVGDWVWFTSIGVATPRIITSIANDTQLELDTTAPTMSGTTLNYIHPQFRALDSAGNVIFTIGNDSVGFGNRPGRLGNTYFGTGIIDFSGNVSIGLMANAGAIGPYSEPDYTAYMSFQGIARGAAMTSSGSQGILLQCTDTSGAIKFQTKISTTTAERMRLTPAGLLGVGTNAPSSLLHAKTPGDVAGLQTITTLEQARTSAGANSDGGQVLLSGKSSTIATQSMGALKWLWVDATHASRKAKLQLTAFDTAERTGLEIAADGVAGITRTLAASEGAYATTAIDLTLTSVHHFVTVTAAKTITLPAAATCTGREYIIKAVANNVVIDANASETIDGSLTATLINGECYQIKSDGANWHVI